MVEDVAARLAVAPSSNWISNSVMLRNTVAPHALARPATWSPGPRGRHRRLRSRRRPVAGVPPAARSVPL